MATWTITVPRDDRASRELRSRTLTQLYNQPPAWLRDAHFELDRHVAAAYGLPVDTPYSAILAALGG